MSEAERLTRTVTRVAGEAAKAMIFAKIQKVEGWLRQKLGMLWQQKQI